MFNDLFNDQEMKTIEWVVMQILNCKYEDIHGKVEVKNTKLARLNRNERRKYVDLLVHYNNNEINIELNNNFNGQYIRNYLYAFILVLRNYLRKDKDYYNKLHKVISVNLNWYKSKELGEKMPPKRVITLPCSDINDDYLLKIIMVNLDSYSKICYNEVTKDDKFYKLLTIKDKMELDYLIQDEELLENYGSKLIELSSKEENMEWKEEYDEILSRIEEYQAAKYEGIEQEKREMIVNLNKNHVSLETIAKSAKLSLARVKEILKEEAVTID